LPDYVSGIVLAGIIIDYQLVTESQSISAEGFNDVRFIPDSGCSDDFWHIDSLLINLPGCNGHSPRLPEQLISLKSFSFINKPESIGSQLSAS